MKKQVFASLVIFASIMFSQAAFADSEQVLIEDLDQLLTQELTQDDLMSSSQDYMLEQAVRPQSRRSSLFAHIMETMVNNATMVKVDKISTTLNS